MSATSPPSSVPASSPVPPSPPDRSLAPDLARGFMLAFIALANVSWFLWGRPMTAKTPHLADGSLLDRITQTLVILFADQRSYPLFAFLFGYGMVQFYRSRIDRGMQPTTVRRMLRRRHWAMILLGLLHATLLFMGDILGAYGVVGLLAVWIFFGRRRRTLVVWCWILAVLLVLYALFSLVGAASLLLAPPEIREEAMAGMAASSFSMEAIRDASHGNPSLLAGMLWRVGSWAVILVQQALSPGILLPVLLGWLAARARLLDEPWDRTRLLRRMALIGIPVGVVGAIPGALENLGVIPLPAEMFWALIGLSTATGVAGALGYVGVFGLLAARVDRHDPAAAAAASAAPPASGALAETPAERAYGRPARSFGPRLSTPSVLEQGIAAVGAPSLSFYLFQSLVFALVLSTTGLGLGGTASPSAAFALALAVWAVSIPLALALDRRGRRGPAEVLLRRMTYGRHDPQARRRPHR